MSMLPAGFVPGLQPRVHVVPFLTVAPQPLGALERSIALAGKVVSVQSPEGAVGVDVARRYGANEESFRTRSL
jgi:hypothetical protein